MMVNEDESYFLEFFKEMRKRIKEKDPKYGDGWKDCNLAKSRLAIVNKFSAWIGLAINNAEIDKDLVDIANQAMLLWIRKKMVVKLCVH